MKRGFVLRRVAEQEFDDSIAWYEGERDGLGQVFRATIEEYFQRIATIPNGFLKSEAKFVAQLSADEGHVSRARSR